MNGGDHWYGLVPDRVLPLWYDVLEVAEDTQGPYAALLRPSVLLTGEEWYQLHALTEKEAPTPPEVRRAPQRSSSNPPPDSLGAAIDDLKPYDQAADWKRKQAGDA